MSSTGKQIVSVFLITVLCLSLISKASAQLDKRANVSRAMFTTSIDNREPVDQVLLYSNTNNTIYFFTDLRHLEGEKIIHR